MCPFCGLVEQAIRLQKNHLLHLVGILFQHVFLFLLYVWMVNLVVLAGGGVAYVL